MFSGIGNRRKSEALAPIFMPILIMAPIDSDIYIDTQIAITTGIIHKNK
jgi:hypothetical protein